MMQIGTKLNIISQPLIIAPVTRQEDYVEGLYCPVLIKILEHETLQGSRGAYDDAI
jgi:hypothetical protein